jgi:molybdopterin converting factor subunit 1
VIEVTARYFAAFRERAGRDAEPLSTTASTAAELYEEVAGRHGFADAHARCKVAINDELVGWDAPLAEGDEVLFFPPVAGG